MPGDKKPDPSETENKRILAVSKHKQENYEILGLKFLCIWLNIHAHIFTKRHIP